MADGSISKATQQIEPLQSSDRSERARNYVKACFQQISLDAHRTGGSSSSSSSPGSSGSTFADRGKVAAVLEAWSVLNPAAVYTQGLNEVTATLLYRHRSNASQAIQELQRLVAPSALGELWSSGMPLYEAGRRQFRPLAEARLPTLMTLMTAADVDESAFLPQAWHSLFAKWLPQELAVAAVDDLLEHGMGAIFAITLTILLEVESDILEALGQPDVEAAEVLLGPGGCFTRLRDRLARCGPALREKWQALQQCPDILDAAEASYSEIHAPGLGKRAISNSMVLLVQQEAVLRLATSASKRHDDKLLAMVHNMNSVQEKATRDELSGDHSLLIKFAVMGDTAVGKSCLVHHGAVDSFVDYGCPTAGVDFASKRVRIRGDQVKLQIWDLSGRRSSSFINLTRSYLHDIAAVLLVYDISCRESYEGIPEWLDEIRKTSQNPDLVILLVGNKLDIEQHRQVEPSEARALAAHHSGIKFFTECSALRGDNVDLLFKQAAQIVHGLTQSVTDRPLQGVRLPDPWCRGRLTGCRRRCEVM